MISARGLTKYYGRLPAIQDVSFEVARGEKLGLVGPRAAGKTTILRILTGYIFPSAGEAYVAGCNVVQQPLDARRHIGYLPETVPLYPEMTVRGYLDFLAGLRGVRPARRRRQRVDEVMARCHIAQVADRPIRTLSHACRRRVALAGALVHEPDVLVLDEPTAGLDPFQIIEMRERIRDVSRARTLILGTHLLSEVEQVCDRVVILHAGRIVAEESQERLGARLRGGDTLSLQIAGAAPAEAIAGLRQLPCVQDVAQEGGNAYLIACTSGAGRRGTGGLRPRSGWQVLERRSDPLGFETIPHRLTQDAEALV